MSGGASRPPRATPRVDVARRRATPRLSEARGRAIAQYVLQAYHEMGEQSLEMLAHDLAWPMKTVEAAVEIALELDLLELDIRGGHIGIHPPAAWRDAYFADLERAEAA